MTLPPAILKEVSVDAYAALLRAVYGNGSMGMEALMDWESLLYTVRNKLALEEATHHSLLQQVRGELNEYKASGKAVPSGTKKLTQYSAPTRAPSIPARDPRVRPAKPTVAKQLLKREPTSEEDDEGWQPSIGAKAKSRQRQKERPAWAPGGAKRGRPTTGGGRNPAPGAMARSTSRTFSAGLAPIRGTRATTDPDPHGYVSRRIWRFYPDEDPGFPWVEGFIIKYNEDSDSYQILYPPNRAVGASVEDVEEDFNFEFAQPTEYVLGDYYTREELEAASSQGLQRRKDHPQPVYISAPPAGKRRRSSAVKVPPTAPFNPAWFETAKVEAGYEDLLQMQRILEAKELELQAELEQQNMNLALGEDLEKRIELERKFQELCNRENELMEELRRIREL